MLDRALILVTAAMAVILAMSSARAFDETKYPDWAGIWTKVPDNGPPRYDPSKPIRKQEAPLKPEYQKMYDASLKDIDGGGFGLVAITRASPWACRARWRASPRWSS